MDASEWKLADEILRWDNETRAILLSIKRIVKYFGTDEEYEWLLAVLHEPEDYLEGVLPAFRDPTWDQNITWVSIPRLTLERGTAEKINSLLVIIKELVPDFIPWAREELDPAHFKAVVRYAGVFLGDMGVDVCDPIWRRFPDLALEGYPIGDPPADLGEAKRSKWPRKVANDTAETLADEIVRWEKETRAILATITRLVDYFGTEEQYESLVAALREPEAYLEGVLPAFRDPSYCADLAGIDAQTFVCERSVAEKITPLLQILAVPKPDVVPWARAELEPAHFGALFRHVGAFRGKFAINVCKPVWNSFPDLAPEGYPLVGSGAANGEPGQQADTKLSPPKP